MGAVCPVHNGHVHLAARRPHAPLNRVAADLQGVGQLPGHHVAAPCRLGRPHLRLVTHSMPPDGAQGPGRRQRGMQLVVLHRGKQVAQGEDAQLGCLGVDVVGRERGDDDRLDPRPHESRAKAAPTVGQGERGGLDEALLVHGAGAGHKYGVPDQRLGVGGVNHKHGRIAADPTLKVPVRAAGLLEHLLNQVPLGGREGNDPDGGGPQPLGVPQTRVVATAQLAHGRLGLGLVCLVGPTQAGGCLDGQGRRIGPARRGRHQVAPVKGVGGKGHQVGRAAPMVVGQGDDRGAQVDCAREQGPLDPLRGVTGIADGHQGGHGLHERQDVVHGQRGCLVDHGQVEAQALGEEARRGGRCGSQAGEAAGKDVRSLLGQSPQGQVGRLPAQSPDKGHLLPIGEVPARRVGSRLGQPADELGRGRVSQEPLSRAVLGRCGVRDRP